MAIGYLLPLSAKPEQEASTDSGWPQLLAIYNAVMAVSQELLDILVCPLDKQPVKLTEQKDGLRCSACGRVYPIVDDIPVMLVDKAKLP